MLRSICAGLLFAMVFGITGCSSETPEEARDRQVKESVQELEALFGQLAEELEGELGGLDNKPEFDDSTAIGSAIRKADDLHTQGLREANFSQNPNYDNFSEAGDILLGLADTHGTAELESYPVKFSMIFYNAACAYSLNSDISKSLQAYKLSVEFGYDDFAHAAQDDDLINLRGSDAYKAYEMELASLAVDEAKNWAANELNSGESFDFDLNLTAVDNQPVRLADHKGKVIIVDFWGTWCPPCRAEIPSFIRLQESYGKAGFQMIGVNYEGDNTEADADKVRNYIESEGINYPCAMGDDVTQEQVPNFNAYPTTVFIDKTGNVRLKLVGLHSYERLAAIVETLMAE
jgi:thiol-disulfide isomerase/thioredoxin